MLDSLTATAEIAVAVFKLRSAYAGSAMRVRRSSDNTEQNIGFDANGNLDTSALLTFAGAGSAYVTIWYDQSGNGRNLTNTTAANQPRIVNAGALETFGKNVRPGMFFDGTNDGLASSSVSRSQPYSRAICARTMASPAAIQDVIASQSYGTPSMMVGPTGNFYMSAGTTSLMSDASVSTAGAINKDWTVVERYNGASSFGDVNGVSRGTTPGTGASTGMNLGGGNNGGTSTKMGMVLYFHSLLSDTDTNTITAASNAYFGVTSYTLAATKASFTATGNTQTLRKGYTLSATTRSYAVATVNANLLRSRVLSATTASFAAASVAVNLVRVRILTALSQAFSVGSAGVNLLRGRKIIATTAAYAAQGQGVTLLYGRRLFMTATNFAVATPLQNLSASRKLSVSAASVGVQTFSVLMAPSNAWTITPAAVAANTASVGLFRSLRLFCTAAAVSVSPNPANVLYGRKLAVTAASFALQPKDVVMYRTLPNSYTLAVTPAAVTVTMQGIRASTPYDASGGSGVWRMKGRR
jgi:hypothetical protein